MNREKIMDEKRIEFGEFLEIIETMDMPRTKEFVDRFYKKIFDDIYDIGFLEGSLRSAEIKRDSWEKKL